MLGGGGGGSLSAGLGVVAQVLEAGVPRVVPISRMAPDGLLLTLSGVGSAAAGLEEAHFSRAVEVFQRFAGRRIAGMIGSEVGPRAVTYGLLESARSGIPVVDAPANGRAHPFFTMGSLGLHRMPHVLGVTVAVGGAAGTAGYVELGLRANVERAARLVRERAARDGVALAVVRNALPAAYVARHAALGGLAYAQRVGRALLDVLPQGAAAVAARLSGVMGGRSLGTGRIVAAGLRDEGGFTVGMVRIARTGRAALQLSVCNEFITVSDGQRMRAVFPDLIALLDHETGLPLSSPDAKAGRLVTVLGVPRGRLILGSPMRDAGLLARLDGLVGRNGLERAA